MKDSERRLYNMTTIINNIENFGSRPPAMGPCCQNEWDRGVVAHLRRRVYDLPDKRREIVALYFGAEFSVADIARILGRSERMISRGLDEVRGQLQSELLAGGFPATMWSRHHEILQTAILTGEPVPPGLKGRILKRIEAQEVAKP